jgi:hypothetical protein
MCCGVIGKIASCIISLIILAVFLVALTVGLVCKRKEERAARNSASINVTEFLTSAMTDHPALTRDDKILCHANGSPVTSKTFYT